MINLPKGVTKITIRQVEIQENPHAGIEEEMVWVCEISDACPLDGTHNRLVRRWNVDMKTAYNEAKEIWEEYE